MTHEPMHIRAKVTKFIDVVMFDENSSVTIEGLGVCRKLLNEQAKVLLEKEGIKTDLVNASFEDLEKLHLDVSDSSMLTYQVKNIPLATAVHAGGFNISYYDTEELAQIASEKPLEINAGELIVRMYKMAREAFKVLNSYMANQPKPMTLEVTDIAFGITLDGDLVITDILDPIYSVWKNNSEEVVFPYELILEAFTENNMDDVFFHFDYNIAGFVQEFCNISYAELVELMFGSIDSDIE